MTALPFLVDLGQIAEILAEIGDEIERIGLELCEDPAVCANHMTLLQNIDLISQTHHGLALALQSTSRTDAAAAIGLEELKSRLGLE